MDVIADAVVRTDDTVRKEVDAGYDAHMGAVYEHVLLLADALYTFEHSVQIRYIDGLPIVVNLEKVDSLLEVPVDSVRVEHHRGCAVRCVVLCVVVVAVHLLQLLLC